MPADDFVVNVECAIRNGERWLMIVRGQEEAHAAGTLSMVGGTLEHADPVEDSLEQALRREVREEVGVEVSTRLQYVESKTFVSDIGRTVLDIVFLGTHESGEPRAQDVGEVAEILWLTFNEICADPRTPPWILQSMTIAARMVADENP